MSNIRPQGHDVVHLANRRMTALDIKLPNGRIGNLCRSFLDVSYWPRSLFKISAGANANDPSIAFSRAPNYSRAIFQRFAVDV